MNANTESACCHSFDTAFGLLPEAVKAGVFPGAAAAVGCSRRLYRSGACGSRSLKPEKLPALPDTLYDLASLTKVVATATLFLLFQEEGRLSALDTVSRYVEGFAGDGRDSVTLLNLLTHTSGLQAHVRLDLLCRDYGDAIRCLTEMPLAYEPGESVVYSCLGYILLGHILEKVGGDRLDVLCRRRIFEPLGMNDTSFNPVSPNVAATAYEAQGGEMLSGRCHDDNARFLGGVSGNAGLFSNIRDLSVFVLMLMNKGRFEGRPFLSGASVAAMTGNYTAHLNQDRGLGWCIRGRRLKGVDPLTASAGDLMHPCAFGHTGFTGTSLWIDPENDIFAILLTNCLHPDRDNADLIRFRPLFHNAVMAGLDR
jgi:CubicO group peptidase (beta-lactamase class C family)